MAANPQATVTDEDRLIAETYRAPLPPIEHFIDDPFYLGNLSKPHGRQREVLEAVFTHGAPYRDVCLDCGRGWGKSYVVSVAILYAAYRVLCLRDPQDYYGIGTGSPISIVNVSVSEKQARRVVFGEVAGKVDQMPCFAQEGFQRNARVTSALEWPEVNLSVYPSSSNPKSDLGANILLAVMDEASWFEEVTYSMRQAGVRQGDRFDQAEALYDLLTPAVRRRGNEKWRRDAMFLMISSPRYVDDFLERQLLAAKDTRRIFALRSPSWEGHEADQLCGETFADAMIGPVPVEYAEEFRANPEQARRMYGAVPSEAIGGFFSEPAAIERNANHDRYGPEEEGQGKAPLFVHVDLGLKRDACGIAGAYAGGPGVIAAFYKRITPAEHGGEIDFEAVREFIIGLRDVQGWRIASVSFDGWQSVDSRQQLRKVGIPTVELSVDRNTEPYDTVKELLLTGRIDYYEDPILFGELRRLELVKGRKVDHQPGGSKDVADAFTGAVYRCGQSIGIVRGVGVLDAPKTPMPDPLSPRRTDRREKPNPYSVEKRPMRFGP